LSDTTPTGDFPGAATPRNFGDGILAGASLDGRVRLYRIIGLSAFAIAVAGMISGWVAPFPDANLLWSEATFVVAAVLMLGFAALARPIVRHNWLRFVYGAVLTSLVMSAGVFFFGPSAGLLGAMGYLAIITFTAFVLSSRFVVATVVLIAVEYAVVNVLQTNASRPVNRWVTLLLLVVLMAFVANVLGHLVSRLQGDLEDVNRNLERRVDEQVAEMERLNRLRSFLPSAVATAVMATENEAALQPHRRQIACVFIDLRGFTRFTSEAEPEEVIEALRAYHRAAGDVMARYEATVGPLQGDGMMAYFNDPVPCDDPTGQATAMALALRPRLDEFAATWRARGFDLSFGIGIAYGYATLGVVGFEGRQEYGPVGTVANLASRLCGHAAAGQVLMDQRTYARLASPVTAEPLDPIAVKGFDRPVSVVAITGTIAPGQEDNP
jgi:class 3 adenylate cyclase